MQDHGQGVGAVHTLPITPSVLRPARTRAAFVSLLAVSWLTIALAATSAVAQERPVSPEMAKKMAEARAAAAGQPTPGQPAPGGAKPGDAKKPDGKPGGESKPSEGNSGGGDGSPVKPPDKPAEEADPKELEVRPDADGKISFVFKGQPWSDVLEWLADISEMSLQWQEVPGGYLNLRARQRYTVPEVRDLINSVMLSRGYTLLRSGEILVVAKLEGLDVSLVPRVTKEELDARGNYEIVKTFFNLNRLRAETVAEELTPLLSKHGKISALKTTNRLEVVETAGNLRRLRDMLADEQNASGQELEIREFPLQYVHADDALKTLKTLLGVKEKSSAPMTPQQMQQMQQMRQQQQQKGGQPPKKDDTEAHLAVNRRNNSIVAHAPPDQLALIEKAIEYLDVESTGPASASPLSRISRIRPYRLTQADPETVIEVLREMGGLAPTTQLTQDKNGKSIIANASMIDHITIAALVEQLNGSERTFDVIPLRRLSAEYVAGSIEFLMNGEEEESNSRGGYYSYRYGSQESSKDEDGKFQVEADTENNRLLIRANEVEKEEIYDLLAKLGEDPRRRGDGPTTHLIRTYSPDETEQLLERLRHAWPSVSPNPLEIQPAPKTDDVETDEVDETKDEEAKDEESPQPEADDTSQEASTAPLANTEFLLAALSETAQPQATESQATEPQTTEPQPAAAEPPEAQPADAQPAQAQPAEGPTPAPAVTDNPLPAVTITRGPEGLVIACDDPAALDALLDLAAQLAPRKQSHHKFKLINTYAIDISYLLEDIFEEDEEEEERWSPYYYYGGYGSSSSDDKDRGRLSDRRPVKFVPDPVTNTVLVLNADAKQLAEIEKLIEMYDADDSIDSKSVRVTKIIPVAYGDATEIADVVKEVYRDLLSPNDKALQKNAQPQQQEQRRFSSFFGSSSDDETTLPRFKGLLSIGVDATANQLVVSSPEFLLGNVEKMISELDKAAKATLPVVQVIKVRPFVTGTMIRDALAEHVKGGTSGNGNQQPQENGKPDKGNGKPGRDGKEQAAAAAAADSE